MNLKITALARTDLLDIGSYTADRWGERQAEQDLRVIDLGLRALTTKPTRGKPCDDLRPGLRRTLAGRHVIFFRVGAAAITIVRVRHAQMLPRRHL